MKALKSMREFLSGLTFTAKLEFEVDHWLFLVMVAAIVGLLIVEITQWVSA